MAEPTVISGDLIVRGAFSAGSIVVPAEQITDAAVSNTAAIAASKLIHHFPVHYSQAAGADVTSVTMPVHVAKANGTISAFKVLPTAAPAGGDKKFTVDLQKSTSAGNYATVLSSVVTIDNTSVNKTPQTGTLSATTYLTGDTFQMVLTASGSTGNQGQGVAAVAFFQEAVA